MPHRTLCEVLEEARKAYETRNFSYLLALIEEIQVLGNRMEAALYEKKDFERLHNERKKLKDEVKQLKVEKRKLEKELKKPKKNKHRGSRFDED